MISTGQLHLMGTVIDIQITGEQSEALVQLALQRLREYEHRFSANDPTAELAEVNVNAGMKSVTVDPQLYQLIAVGKAHSLAQGSHLNIAIGPLIQSWRIGFEDARVPAEEEIQTRLKLIDPEKIQLDSTGSSVFLTEPGMRLDLGALAKGYIADLIVAELKEKGVEAGLLNLGGNVLTFGVASHEDGWWRIGIRDPLKGPDELAYLLKVADKSVVTSGIYERSLQQGGRRYHHIFDSRTGYPVAAETASLTIISDDSLDGEIWTTRLFGAPPQEIIATIDQQPEIEGVLIQQDGTHYTSSGFAEFLA